MSKIICVSGFFDPICPHHIQMFKNARQHGEFLLVIVNNDIQLRRKTGLQPFYTEQERLEIIREIKGVDRVLLSIDEGDNSICRTLTLFHTHVMPIDLFFNDGDVDNDCRVLEKDTCNILGIKLKFGGSPKSGSSSLIKKRFLDSNTYPLRICEEDVGSTIEITR